MTNAPFHSGELKVQERAGEAAIARRNGSAISGNVMVGARSFLRLQPMIVLSSSDEGSALWASIIFGRPGFLASEDGSSLDIDLNRALVDPDDPVWANIRREKRLGSLVIELASRRRIRINGAARLDENLHLRIDVEESFPACPKYITRRHVRLASLETPAADGAPTPGTEPTQARFATLANADTMFVATQCGSGCAARCSLRPLGFRAWVHFKDTGSFQSSRSDLHFFASDATGMSERITSGRSTQNTDRAPAENQVH